ncbi:MAG: metallophosphoesterase [Acidobacteria bacterium]|nr:metallophosphoesterase [Acidobacteriota bacterium]
MNKKATLSLLSALAVILGAFAFVVNGTTPDRQSSISPAKQSATSIVRFAAFGDMGTGDSDQRNVAFSMVAYHSKNPFDTVLMLGDNIYPDGNPKDLLDKFERPYAELIRRGVNFYASLGNHDVRRGREAQTHYPLFHMDGHSYYSFTKGPKDENLVEFFALDSTSFDEEQHRWLEGALAKSKAQWKVAFFHHPIYSSGRTHGSDTRLRAQLEPLFVKYGVAVAFSGHDHVYERVKPQQGVQYFVCGIGGKLRSGNLDRRSPLTAFGNDEVNGFMAVEVTPEHLSFQAVDASGHVFDSGEIMPRARARAVGIN